MADIDVVASGLDQDEVSNLVAYVNGEVSEPPKQLEKMQTGLYSKMQTVAGYSVAAEVARQARLSRFLAKIEEELFDEDMLATMSHEDLMDLHARVSNENNRSQESTRRWLKENRDLVSGGKKTEAEKLAQQLSTLSPDKLDSIKKILQGETLLKQDDDVVDL